MPNFLNADEINNIVNGVHVITLSLGPTVVVAATALFNNNNNNNNNTQDNLWCCHHHLVIARVLLSCDECRAAPGGCRPFDQVDRPES